MLDQENVQTAPNSSQVSGVYDLVVIGAGVAGLNALFAATEYLSKDARVLLLDQKSMAGGMWNTAYDYVRLHQPHPMFTVGDMDWGWNKPRDYLAKRDEVRDHLASSLDAVRKAVTLRTEFGQTVSGCEEIATANGFRAKITFHPNGAAENLISVEAERAFFASGLNYREADPIPVSSENFISIIPQHLVATLAEHPDAQVYVVGGGKTGMDTILATIAADPRRTIHLIKGPGTNFLNRTKYIPTGLKRWTSGELVSRLFRDLALSFDGDNEEDAIARFRSHHSTDPESPNGVFLYGLQSEEELNKVQSGVSDMIDDYLVDVVDTESGPVIELRSGEVRPIEPGSIIVNCTGSFFRSDELQKQMPCLSPHGTVVSITPRDGFHFLTSVSGFFLTHLHYRDQLRGNGFYTLDHEALFRKNRNAWVGASAAQAYMNQVLSVQTLPMTLLDRCGLDLDRWYPFPRRMAGIVKMKATAKADVAHARKALDRVAERFGLHCGPLN